MCASDESVRTNSLLFRMRILSAFVNNVLSIILSIFWAFMKRSTSSSWLIKLYALSMSFFSRFYRRHAKIVLLSWKGFLFSICLNCLMVADFYFLSCFSGWSMSCLNTRPRRNSSIGFPRNTKFIDNTIDRRAFSAS